MPNCFLPIIKIIATTPTREGVFRNFLLLQNRKVTKPPYCIRIKTTASIRLKVSYFTKRETISRAREVLHYIPFNAHICDKKEESAFSRPLSCLLTLLFIIYVTDIQAVGSLFYTYTTTNIVPNCSMVVP